MRRGLICGVLAGALWGMVFVVPTLLPDFSGLLLSVSRYVIYGAISALLLLPNARAVAQQLTRDDLLSLVKLSLAGNIIYYVLLATAIQLIGGAPVSLIIGVLPVVVTLMGRRDHGAVPLKHLAAPLSCVMAGIVCINLQVFLGPTPVLPAAATIAPHGTVPHWAASMVGMLCAIAALASWSWFAVANARYLQSNTRFDGTQWSLLCGCATGGLALLLGIVVSFLPTRLVAMPEADATGRWLLFGCAGLVLALGASVVGNGLWNEAARRLPLTLSGQLIVFETLFALLYSFGLAQRWPRPLEIAAMAFLSIGVGAAIRIHALRDDAVRTATVAASLGHGP